MTNNIYFINDFYDTKFVSLFRNYFSELGIRLSENTDVFDEITKSAENEGMKTLVLENETGYVGFIMFQKESFLSDSKFFSHVTLFIREFYIKEGNRKKGYGKLLMGKVLEYAKEHTISKVILTTDTAFDFYYNLGFVIDESYAAKNNDKVLIKIL